MDDDDTEEDPSAVLEEDKTELYENENRSWRWLVNFETALTLPNTNTANTVTVLVYVPVHGMYVELNSRRPRTVAALK